MLTRRLFPIAALVMLVGSCGSRQLSADCEGMCEPAGPAYPGVGECVAGACTPTYSECVSVEDVATCAEACEARGTTCAANSCGGHTYRIYAVLEWCQDPELDGGGIERSCDEPIDWQLNEAVKCCCDQP